MARRGGGAPFCVDVVRDGLRVGRLSGQVAMHSFDELREKVGHTAARVRVRAGRGRVEIDTNRPSHACCGQSERIAAMQKLINRRKEQAAIDRSLTSALEE